MLKLVVVGSTRCVPCTVLKNQLNDRYEELEELQADFMYINLDGLEDKDTFIQAHKLTSTPTIWVEKDGQKLLEFNGYVDADELFKKIGGLK